MKKPVKRRRPRQPKPDVNVAAKSMIDAIIARTEGGRSQPKTRKKQSR